MGQRHQTYVVSKNKEGEVNFASFYKHWNSPRSQPYGAMAFVKLFAKWHESKTQSGMIIRGDWQKAYRYVAAITDDGLNDFVDETDTYKKVSDLYKEDNNNGWQIVYLWENRVIGADGKDAEGFFWDMSIGFKGGKSEADELAGLDGYLPAAIYFESVVSPTDAAVQAEWLKEVREDGCLGAAANAYDMLTDGFGTICGGFDSDKMDEAEALIKAYIKENNKKTGKSKKEDELLGKLPPAFTPEEIEKMEVMGVSKAPRELTLAEEKSWTPKKMMKAPRRKPIKKIMPVDVKSAMSFLDEEISEISAKWPATGIE